MFLSAPTRHSDEEENEVNGDENYLRGVFVLPIVIIVINQKINILKVYLPETLPHKSYMLLLFILVIFALKSRN